jgi:transposase
MLELVKSDTDMQSKMQILTSIPSIGNIVALTLISEMPELGKLGDKQISALAGLAPQDKQSGIRSGKAAIRGGRKCVRAALYMAAMSAKKHNPNIKPFYERLTQNGKPKMLALTAAMRKLLLLANSLLKQNKLWTQTKLPA